MPDTPLVSCLCVTRGKPRKLLRAIGCFLAQKYPRKELVLVYEDDDLPTEQVVQEAVATGGAFVVGVRVPSKPKLELGALRNLAVQNARGEYCCQWDDDDWYHHQRIAIQLQTALASQRQACVLSRWLMYDELESQAYLSRVRKWEGSVLCKKDVMTSHTSYPSLGRGEDRVFVDLLVERNLVVSLDNAALYIYTAHASNTWPRQHFVKLFSHSTKLSAEASTLIGDILSGRHSVDAGSLLLNASLKQ